MRKIKTIIIAIMLFNIALAKAQDITGNGIHFEQQLKWSEILTKAKAEHKYIFVDCYATWCGPCKYMDATVYSTKEVGEVYNKDFISIRVQMDQTAADDSVTKSRYARAKMFEQDYHVNAYPTFLFFDSDGKPVHKIIGALNLKEFIGLATDAQNPDKQYYAVLRSFQPGKLDTGEEKSLAHTFVNSDHDLGAKLALDYLTRIPKKKLKLYDAGQLMFWYRDNPAIMDLTIDYIHGLTKDQFLNGGNQRFMWALHDQRKIQQIINDYASKLNAKEISLKENLNFFLDFSESPTVKQIAKRYIAELSEKEINNETILDFLSKFTTSTEEKGFEFIYRHPDLADRIKKDTDWAQSFITNIIYQTDFQSQLEKYAPPVAPPGFDSLVNLTAKKYNSNYAKRIASEKKADWYSYLVNNKKDDRYWPQLSQGDMERIEKFADSPVLTFNQWSDINDICYTDIFLHSDDTAKISLAIKWMKHVIITNSSSTPDVLDTYACLLYKMGKTDEALKAEVEALQICMTYRQKGTYNKMMHTTLAIQEMWKDAKIWEEKEFQ